MCVSHVEALLTLRPYAPNKIELFHPEDVNLGIREGEFNCAAASVRHAKSTCSLRVNRGRTRLSVLEFYITPFLTRDELEVVIATGPNTGVVLKDVVE